MAKSITSPEMFRYSTAASCTKERICGEDAKYESSTHLLKSVGLKVYGRFAPLMFRPLDVSPLHWTFRPLNVLPPRTFRHQDVSPPGRFATWTFRPLTGRFAPDCGRFASVCFSMCLLFFRTPERDGRVTDRIAINISHKCGDTR